MPSPSPKNGRSGRRFTICDFDNMNGKLLENARALRTSQTDAESILWRALRTKRLAQYKFKRQQPIGNYIVDFVCLIEKLVIEADGGQHNDSTADAVRDDWLRSKGYRVVRFWNTEILGNEEGVLETILRHHSPSPSVPPPRGGREEKHESASTRDDLASLPSRERGWREGAGS